MVGISGAALARVGFAGSFFECLAGSRAVAAATATLRAGGSAVDAALAAFIEDEVVAPLGRDVAQFWAGFAALVERFVPVNRALLARREDLQAQIDAWHTARAGQPIDGGATVAPLALGGSNAPANLRVLCREHNQHEAWRKLGHEPRYILGRSCPGEINRHY